MPTSVARRIARGYATLGVVLGMVVASTLAAGVLAHQAGEDMTKVSLPRIRETRDALTAIERMRVGAIRYVAEPAARAEALKMVTTEEANVRGLLDAMREHERTPEQHARFTAMLAGFDRFLADDDAIRAAVARKDLPNARAALLRAQIDGERLRLDALAYSDLYLQRIAAAREFADDVMRLAAALAVAMALAAAAIAYLNWRRETREVVGPLGELRLAMDALSRGGTIAASHPAAARTAELLALQEGFNAMAAQICSDAAALEAANDHLEARVAEQTAELRAAKADLERSFEELRALDKLKSDFMAVVSHELLTPINFIIGFGSALEDGLLGPLNERQADAVTKLMGGAERLTRMVRNTLEYTKALSGELHVAPSELAFAPLVRAVADEAAPSLAAKGQRLELDLPEDLPAVRADGDRAAQVLAELVANASEFSPRGTAIAVRVTAAPDGVTTEVADQGPGIDPAVLDRLFEPFYQADSTSTREHGGMGLGLAIARHLVGAMGGTIVAASAPGGGARLWFTLPTAAARVEDRAPR